MIDKNIIISILGYLKKANNILLITGAGISADSGLPTYRGMSGLYNSGDTEDGMPIETALAGSTMGERPDITWKHLYKLEENCRGATFNRAHSVIAEMEREFERVWVLTQNIDGFHHAAGSTNVIDIHGDMHKLRCTRCSYRTTVTDYAGLEIPPLCPHCEGIVRPDVVLFGEMLPIEKCKVLQRELARGFDIVFSIGTTSVFPYIAEPVVSAKYKGIPTVEVNPGLTEVSYIVDIKIPAGARETLDLIWTMYSKDGTCDNS